jgi:carbamoyl-phosphate synthase large subunit
MVSEIRDKGTVERKRINILFTCVGRRVALVGAFQRAARELNLSCATVGADVNPLSPGLYVCDQSVITRPIIDQGYITQLLEIVQDQKIDLIIPTIDTELFHLAEHREQFEQLGARVLISSPEVISVCEDKRNAYRFLREHHFDTPQTRELAEVRGEELTFPVFLKPWDGSASRGSTVVRSREEFDYVARRIPNCLLQEHVVGQEYTCDVYVDFAGEVRCVVPRKRIETRSGEVSKSQTVRLPEMMEACRRLVQTLGAGPGVITIQCFLTSDNAIKFIEINPRFGGGVILSIQAGADFPRWILSEMTGQSSEIEFEGWRDSLYMLRYDEAVWVDASKVAK